MKRLFGIIAASLGVLLLAGCSGQSQQSQKLSLRLQTKLVLAESENYWSTSKYSEIKVNKNGRLGKQSLKHSSTPTLMISHDGTINNATKQIHYAAFKQAMKQNEASAGNDGYEQRFFTLADLNVNLKEVHAGVTLKSFDDLVYYKNQGVGYVTKGNKLYALYLTYTYSKTLPMGTGSEAVMVATRGGYTTPKRHLTNAQLQGRWVSQDGSSDAASVVVDDGMMYWHNAQQYCRTAVEDLRTENAATVYGSTSFQGALSYAMGEGYSIPRTTARAAGAENYTYLFIDKNTMVKLGYGSKQTFKKVTSDTSTPDVPSNIIQLFKDLDTKKTGGANRAAVLSQLGSNYVVGFYDSINEVTQQHQQNKIVVKTVTATGGSLE